jgi:hypothetical protein
MFNFKKLIPAGRLSAILALQSMFACAAVADPVAAMDRRVPDETAPCRVEVGIFLGAVPQIDLAASRFSFDAYLWFRWDPEAWPPASARGQDEVPAGPWETFEIVDGMEVETRVLASRPGYCCLRVWGDRLNYWDVRDYPFDRQHLSIVVEDASFDAREVVYEIDAANSANSPKLAVPGGVPGTLVASVERFAYPTNFGEPDLATLGESVYSRATFTTPVDRQSTAVFFKLFTALFVSTLVALVALFINPLQVDPRFGLCVGGLFGIVASGYAVSSVLPDASGFSYADKLHMGALVCVVAVVIESAYSLSLHLNHGDAGAARAKRLDRIAFAVVCLGYAGSVIVLM